MEERYLPFSQCGSEGPEDFLETTVSETDLVPAYPTQLGCHWIKLQRGEEISDLLREVEINNC